MSVESKLSKLEDLLSPNCEVITNSSPAKFQEYCKRWTDVDRQIPAAIVFPRSERDCQKVIQWANESQVPFVVVGGGCSEWSTIGFEGIEIDLSSYSSISVDQKAQTVTITGAVTQKELATKLAEHGLFTGGIPCDHWLFSQSAQKKILTKSPSSQLLATEIQSE